MGHALAALVLCRHVEWEFLVWVWVLLVILVCASADDNVWREKGRSEVDIDLAEGKSTPYLTRYHPTLDIMTLGTSIMCHVKAAYVCQPTMSRLRTVAASFVA